MATSKATIFRGYGSAPQRYTTVGGTVTANAGVRWLNIDATQTSLTINFPASPSDGQEFGITSWYSSTGITCAATGKNLAAPITTLTPTTPASWVYQAATSTWLRTN